MDKIYIAIDLKSFYASVECKERNLDPLTTNLVVADFSRTSKTICLAVSPSLKSYGIPGRARLFEVEQKVKEINIKRRKEINYKYFISKSTNNTEIINNNVDYSNPYWDYIKYDLISVNFNDLKEINNDTVAWIKVNGTNINYPVVKTTDNDYYLTHSFNKDYNEAGWVFMDYRNNGDEKNTIIYAHSRLDKTMFGSLKGILEDKWLSDNSNYVVKLSTPTENTLWQVYSVYRIPTTSDYLQTYFSTDEEFNNFNNMLINRSIYNFNTSVSPTDRILTLSTCYNNNDKVVLHAKLIKREIRN